MQEIKYQNGVAGKKYYKKGNNPLKNLLLTLVLFGGAEKKS